MWPRGSISPEKVRQVREWWAQVRALGTTKQKAAELGISRAAMRRIIQGRNYRWVR